MTAFPYRRRTIRAGGFGSGFTGPSLRGVVFATVSESVDAKGFPDGERWLDCRLKDGQWHGAGDETRLAEIIAIFLAWAESCAQS
jgi:hypothetical protein